MVKLTLNLWMNGYDSFFVYTFFSPVILIKKKHPSVFQQQFFFSVINS